MRSIDQAHHDGLGLNDRIHITADEQDPNSGNASHHYIGRIDEDTAHEAICIDIQFQHGPRNVEGSVPGATEAAVIAVLIDRLRGFQSGPFSCRENALVLTKLEEALQWTQHRARERHRRGVLGKNEK